MKKSKQGSHTVVELCPCGTGLPYPGCCGRWHTGPERLQAPDAETLMRSRYSAFVKEDAVYLLDTWHPDTRPATLDFEPGLHWLGLEVKEHVPGPVSKVTFVARARQAGGRAFRQQERSRFVRENERWFYVDGDA